jgi:hydrogenase nickel incorporation protein HypA/HybF
VHELSLSRAVITTVEKHAAGRRVAVVRVRIGRMRQVVPETLGFYFDFAARDTVCDGARLEMELVEVQLRCTACDRSWAIEVPSFRCPACSSSRAEITSGNEFDVESIEVEEDACIGQR